MKLKPNPFLALSLPHKSTYNKRPISYFLNPNNPKFPTFQSIETQNTKTQKIKEEKCLSIDPPTTIRDQIMRNPSRKATATTMSSATTTTSTVTSSTPCCSKVGLKRGPWTPEEDELLSNYIKKEGEGKWRTLPKRAGLLRCGKSCRLRWMNYLRPNVKRGQISDDEEDLILRLHRLLGNRWSLIAGRIPGRTDNEIKNYWNTHLSKKLISQGIDPRTHKPLMNSSSSTTKIASFSSSPSKERRNSASSSLSSDKKDPNDEYHHNNNNSNKDHVEGPILIIAKEDGNNNNNNHFLDDQIDDDHDHDQMADGYTSLLMDCDDHYSTVMPKRSNNYNGDNTYHQRFGNEEDENMMNNYYSEDAFSSFLNSLINEDDFTTSQHHHRQLLSFDPMISNPMTAPTLGFGAGWESPMISSSLNHSSDLKRVNNDDNVDG